MYFFHTFPPISTVSTTTTNPSGGFLRKINANLRQDMNVEDEYFSAIENRDTAIMMRDKRIAEQDAILEEKEYRLKQNEQQLKQNEEQLKQSEQQLKQNENLLGQQQAALLTSAKAMKTAGIPAEQIAAMTTLPIETVIKL